MKFVRFLLMLLIAFTLSYNSYGQGNLPFGQATSRSRCLGELQTDSGLRFQPRILGKFKGTNDSTCIIAVNKNDSLPYYSKDGANWYPLIQNITSPGVVFSDTLAGRPMYTKAMSANNILQGGNAFGTTEVVGTTDSNGFKVLVNNKDAFHIWRDGGMSAGTNEYGSNIYALKKQLTMGDSVLQNIGIDLIGNKPFPLITTGNANVSVGVNASQRLTIGGGNTALGYQAFKSNRAGSANTCLGYNTLVNDTAGSNNTSIGYRSGPILINGSGNTWIGAQVGDAKAQAVSCTYVGYNAGGSNGSNNIQRNVQGQLFLGQNIGTQDSTDYDWGIGYNASNNYGGGFAIFGNFAGGWTYLIGNDTVKGTWSITKTPVYTGTGAADSTLIIPTGTGGTIFKRAANIRVTGTLDFPSTNSLNQSTLTISVTGAKAGDPVSVGIPSTSTTGSYTAACFADGVVSVIFSNVTGGTIDPASGTYTVVVSK